MESFDVVVVGMGALGSAAAYHLARRGQSVIGLEQFELGHSRGASHDTSRIIRTSYGATEYVRLAQSAYRDWADFEAVAGETFVTVTGGVIFVPQEGPYRASDYTASLDECDIPYELLARDEVRARWPQFNLPDGVETIFTADSGLVHASRSVAALQMQARLHGAVVRERTRVLSLEPEEAGVIVRTSGGDIHAGSVILATDAWTNELLEPLGASIPLVTMQEQVTYFKPADADPFDRDDFPVWIWLGDECFYGFPTYGEPTVKAARDLSENLMTPAERTFEPSPALLAELSGFMASVIPASGPALRTVTCQYAITADRNFVISPLGQHPNIIVALGAGHAFKFTPTIGRILAELVVDGATGDDISAFTVAPNAVSLTG